MNVLDVFAWGLTAFAFYVLIVLLIARFCGTNRHAIADRGPSSNHPAAAALNRDPVDAHFDTAVREPVSFVKVLADEALLERLRAGETPSDGLMERTLAAWRDDCQEGTGKLDLSEGPTT